MRTPRPFRLLAALAGLLLVLGTGCSASREAGPGADSSTSGTWTFTDDLGETITLDRTPTRVAGLSDVVYSLMNYELEPVASFGYSDLATDPASPSWTPPASSSSARRTARSTSRRWPRPRPTSS